MKKPKIETEEQAAAQDRSRRQSADRRLLAGGGRPFQVAPRHGRSGRRSRHSSEKSIPDASGAGLRRRDQDTFDDRMARAGIMCDLAYFERSGYRLTLKENTSSRFNQRPIQALGPAAAALLAGQPVRQVRGLFARRLWLGARLFGGCGRRRPARPPRGQVARPSALPCCRSRPLTRRRGRSCRYGPRWRHARPS